jgi:aminoglycoside phosphotransferase (APT) family kinase protein
MYTVENIHHQLLRLGLIARDALLNGDYEATTVNRRNKNITVTTNKRQNYFIKQTDPVNAENAKTLKNEILFYSRIDTHLPQLKGCVAELEHADADQLLLILKYRSSMPLWRHYKREAVNEIPSATLESVGKLLGQLHASLSAIHLRSLAEFEFLGSELPFIFKLHRPHPDILQWASSGAIKFIERLQAHNEIDRHWQDAIRRWEVDAIIHGDIKLDNFIIDLQGGINEIGKEKQIKVVDWEMAQFGDTAWDIAGVLNDFIFWWAITMPDDTPPEEMIKHAKFPLANIKPGVNAFWDGYAAASNFAPDVLARQLEKAVLFAGLRIMQTSFEISSRFDAMPPIAVLLFNIGASILNNPQRACDQLYGVQHRVADMVEPCEAPYGA